MMNLISVILHTMFVCNLLQMWVSAAHTFFSFYFCYLIFGSACDVSSLGIFYNAIVATFCLD